MLNRGDVSYIEPGAMITFGACNSPAQLVEVVIEAFSGDDPLMIWVRRDAGPLLGTEINDDLSNHVTWWPL